MGTLTSPLTESILQRRLNVLIGTHELSAWQPVPGICWVQTRSPDFARKLARRRDSRLVVRGVAGGYLRTFEIPRNLSWARRLIARYTQNGTGTNEQKNASVPPVAAKAKEIGFP